MLLNKKEIEIAIAKLKEENMPFSTIEEALEVAKINALNNGTTMLYVIKIPLTIKETFMNILIKAVKKENKIVNLTYKEVLRNKDKIFGIKHKCKQFNSVQICNKDQLIDISNSTCIPNLIKSLKSSCTISNSHHIPPIEQIQPGMILLNEFKGTINTGTTDRMITGTYLIKFHNLTIRINNETYSSLEASPLETVPAIMQPTPMEKDRINLLSLEALNELHINNTKHIKFLQTDATIDKISIFGSSSFIIAFIIFVTIWLKNSRKITIREKPTPVLISAEPIRSPSETSTTDSPNTKFNNLPYF